MLPKSANVGSLIHALRASVEVYNHIALGLNGLVETTKQDEVVSAIGKWPLPPIAAEVAFEPSVDRFKRAMPECTDACAVTTSLSMQTAALLVNAIEWTHFGVTTPLGTRLPGLLAAALFPALRASVHGQIYMLNAVPT